MSPLSKLSALLIMPFLLGTPTQAMAQELTKLAWPHSQTLGRKAQYPSELRYVRDHWHIRPISDRYVVIGATEFLTTSLGGVTSIELPKSGQVFKRWDKCGVIESDISIADLLMPVSGRIVAVNPNLSQEPGLVFRNCYTTGWLMTVELSNPQELNETLSSLDYKIRLPYDQ